MAHQDNRILYFTRRPEIEARVKRLVPNPRQNSQVIRHLYEWVKATIRESEIPFEELNESRQRGNSFGEKLANGIQNLIEDGASNIIVVGNDSPDLLPSDLSMALEYLKAGSQVLGDSISGGSWIIGIRSCDFDKEKFESLPWQTARLGGALKSLMESQGKVSFLTARFDINNPETFESLLESDSDNRFWKVIRAWLYEHLDHREEFQIDLQLLSIAQPTLRAPPAFS